MMAPEGNHEPACEYGAAYASARSTIGHSRHWVP
jgi:hypothetical protein